MPDERVSDEGLAEERPGRASEKFSDDPDDGALREAVQQPPAQWQGLFRKRHPLVVLYTGNGKGKTSSALGVTLRAWGRGWKICWLQFIKSKTSHYGETRAAAAMGIEMIPLGDGFTWLSKDIDKDIALGVGFSVDGDHQTVANLDTIRRIDDLNRLLNDCRSLHGLVLLLLLRLYRHNLTGNRHLL